MVGPGEVDDDLQPEVTEECSKYGEVTNCLIFEVRMLYIYIYIYHGEEVYMVNIQSNYDRGRGVYVHHNTASST